MRCLKIISLSWRCFTCNYQIHEISNWARMYKRWKIIIEMFCLLFFQKVARGLKKYPFCFHLLFKYKNPLVLSSPHLNACWNVDDMALLVFTLKCVLDPEGIFRLFTLRHKLVYAFLHLHIMKMEMPAEIFFGTKWRWKISFSFNQTKKLALKI